MQRAHAEPLALTRWTAKRDDDGAAVEFQLVRATNRSRRKDALTLAPSIRSLRLELRYPDSPGWWQPISFVADVDEAEHVLDLFYEGLFSEIERVG